jgi:hypothetical protein
VTDGSFRLGDETARYLARLNPGGLWRRAGVEEKALVAFSAGGWIALIASANGGGGICGGSWHGAPVISDLGWRTIMAALMNLAMMLPLTSSSLRFLMLRSFPWRRRRAAGWCLAGYLGLWMLATLVLSLAASAAQASAHGGVWVAAGGFLIAAVWQLTPFKQWALRACHHTQPIYPTGVRGDLACAGFGVRIAGACVVSCAPLMLAAMVAPAPILAMAGMFAIALFERRVWRPPTAPTAIGLALVAAGIAGSALFAI